MSRCALMVAVISLAGANLAHAQMIGFTVGNYTTATFRGSTALQYHTPGTHRNTYSTGYGGTIPITLDGQTQQIMAFCSELLEPVSAGVTYDDYEIDPLEESGASSGGQGGIPIGGIGADRAARIRKLYALHYQGLNASAWTANEGAAFQLAVWELTHDNSANGYGEIRAVGPAFTREDQFYISGSTSTTIRNLAQSYLDDVMDDNYMPNASMSVAALTNFGDNGPLSGNQDLLIPSAAVPEPSSLILLSLAGLTGTVVQYRRRKRKKCAPLDIANA